MATHTHTHTHHIVILLGPEAVEHSTGSGGHPVGESLADSRGVNVLKSAGVYGYINTLAQREGGVERKRERERGRQRW